MSALSLSPVSRFQKSALSSSESQQEVNFNVLSLNFQSASFTDTDEQEV